ncbi:MAG TPA: hypothetical protein VGP93_18060, partial [Polyangiaceae bacterium]|nr:hypothetical protein [Polyangiaceae bacterium]
KPVDALSKDDKSRGSLGFSDVKKPQQRVAQQSQQLVQDPKAIIQTGPGIPRWRWSTSTLSWSGPVDHEHHFKLYLLSPAVQAVLGFLRVALLVALGWVFFRKAPFGSEPPERRTKTTKTAPPAAATAAVLLLAVAGLLWSRTAHAETPSPELLEQLKARLSQPPACGNACVSVSQAVLEVRGNRLTIKLEVHAGAPESVPLPGPAQSWVFESIVLDGKATAGVALQSDGHLHARLDAGRHELKLEGPIAGDELTLAFGLNPHQVIVKAEGWDVEGLREDGRIDGSLRLLRRLKKNEAPAQNNVSLPPWFEIERRLELGVTWKIVSTLRRVSPAGTPALIRFPLLEGERVEGDRPVENGALILALGRDDSEATWESALDLRQDLTLRAPEKASWSEVWVLDCGVVWRCTTSGIPPVAQQTDGHWQPTFRPWPTEQLGILLARPQAAPGSSTTIDMVAYSIRPGQRLLRGALDLHLRSTTGGSQILRLPEGAKLQLLKVNGSERATHQDGRALSVALVTGAQRIEAEWQEPIGVNTYFRAPLVDIGRPSVNARVAIILPDERWILLAGGPSWGPAILFWGYLLVVLGAAFALGRLRRGPLSTVQWALLGLGLTQVPAAVAIAIAAWFFLISYRKSFQSERRWVHNLFQLFIVTATLVFLGLLISSVYNGLVVRPDMQVQGAGSYETSLVWYVDRAGAELPRPWVLSAPLWVWRGLMLAWALWLAVSLVRWLRWAWSNFSTGALWMPRPPKPRPKAPEVPPPAANFPPAEPGS